MAYEQIDPASREGQGAIFKKRCLEYLVGLYGTEKLNAPDKAEAVGKQIVALDPKDVNNYFGMAQLYQDAGRIEEAEQMLLRAKEVAPNSVDVQLQLAGLLQQAGQLRQDDGSVPDPHPARAEQPRGVPHGGRLLRGEGPQGLHASARRSRPTTSSAVSRPPTKAIEIKDDYVDAMVMKNLLLRQQALVEKSPARQQELLKEANALRDKAIETRNRLQGEADAEAEAKAKDAKKSE